jgi:hypothetical protein
VLTHSAFPLALILGNITKSNLVKAKRMQEFFNQKSVFMRQVTPAKLRKSGFVELSVARQRN